MNTKSNKPVRIAHEKINQVVDQETGELIETNREISHVYKDREPPYIKLYLTDVLSMIGLSATSSSVLYSLLQKMEFGTNLIYVNNHLKKEIAQNLDIKIGSINNTITKFVKREIFERVGQGTYRANPMYFGTGSWDSIRKIRLELEYSYDHTTQKSKKTFVSEFEREEPKNKTIFNEHLYDLPEDSYKEENNLSESNDEIQGQIQFDV